MNTYGVNGGGPGDAYGISVRRGDGTIEEVAGMSDNIKIEAGSVVRIKTTGGGGWGDPLEREAEMVCADVRAGLVSEQAALEDYGVVLVKDSHHLGADLSATANRRAEMRAARGKLAMFDRGPYFEQIKRDTGINWPDGWSDPDAGCDATEVNQIRIDQTDIDEKNWPDEATAVRLRNA